MEKGASSRQAGQPCHGVTTVRAARAWPNFTVRDKQQLANPSAGVDSTAYRRQIVDYHRKEAPGSILVDTDTRYVYYVLPQGKAVRYGAIVGRSGQA